MKFFSPSFLFSITSSKFEDQAIEFLIDGIAKLCNLSCRIDFLKYLFINFSFENDLSALSVVTGIVTNNLNAVHISGKLHEIK